MNNRFIRIIGGILGGILGVKIIVVPLLCLMISLIKLGAYIGILFLAFSVYVPENKWRMSVDTLIEDHLIRQSFYSTLLTAPKQVIINN